MNDNFTVNETTQVSFVFGVDTEITFEDLIKVISTSDSYFENIYEYVEEIIEELNNSGYSSWDGAYFDIIELEYDNGKKEKTLILEGDDECINKDGILENIFNEEFVKLERVQFGLDVKDYEGVSFVFTNITVNNHENLRFFTRNDWYSDLKPLKSKNIIPSNELKDITKYFHGDKVIYDAKKITGLMLKKDFNPEKWWLGWELNF